MKLIPDTNDHKETEIWKDAWTKAWSIGKNRYDRSWDAIKAVNEYRKTIQERTNDNANQNE